MLGVAKTSPVNFKLLWLSTGKALLNVVHVNRLKICHTRHQFPIGALSNTDAGGVIPINTDQHAISVNETHDRAGSPPPPPDVNTSQLDHESPGTAKTKPIIHGINDEGHRCLKYRQF